MKTLGLHDPAFLASASAESPYASPDEIAGLIRWYDAANYDDDGLTDGDDLVNDFIDLSSTGDDATVDGTYPPHWADGYMPSGKNCVLCPDGWHHWDITEVTLSDYTVVCLWKPMADAILASSTSGNYQVRNEGGGSLNFRPYLYHNGGSILQNNVAEDCTVWHVSAWSRNGTTGVPKFSYNKTHYNEDSGDTDTNDQKINTIGLYNGGPGYFYLAEIAIYNAVISTDDLDSLYDGFWSIKYATDIGS